MQVENLVAIELAYINTKHPDFTEAHLVHKIMTEVTAEGPREIPKELPTKAPDNKDKVSIWNVLYGLIRDKKDINHHTIQSKHLISIFCSLFH